MREYIGKRVTFLSAIYLYEGTLIEVKDDYFVLDDAKVVFETGKLDNGKPDYDNFVCVPHKRWNVMKALVESFGEVK